MNARKPWPRILVIAGGIAMVAGALDPLEGAVVIRSQDQPITR